jgi:NNP family nitrate/nitrite transporter-like MFS transporter
LVGAAGGLGGFFPPIELGILKDVTGSYAFGFVIFSLFALTCGLVISRIFLHTPAPAN